MISDIQEKIWVVNSPGKAPMNFYKGRIMVMIHVFIKKNKKRPCSTALRRGGVYPAYPIWPQRSLLCTLEVSTPITSLVFISLPWSQRNRNTYAVFLIRLIFLNSLHCYHDRQCTLIPIFFTSGPLCFFLISYFSLGVFGPGLNILFSAKTLVSFTDHCLSGSSYGCAVSDEQAACSSHHHMHKYMTWVFSLTLRMGTRQLGSRMSKCLS